MDVEAAAGWGQWLSSPACLPSLELVAGPATERLPSYHPRDLPVITPGRSAGHRKSSNATDERLQFPHLTDWVRRPWKGAGANGRLATRHASLGLAPQTGKSKTTSNRSPITKPRRKST